MAQRFERGKLKAGEWLLVHGGAGGIGVTAIQLAGIRREGDRKDQLCDVKAETDGNEARSRSSIGRPPQ